MKLSVIIPVYNAEPFLKRCLNSLTPAEPGQFEILRQLRKENDKR